VPQSWWRMVLFLLWPLRSHGNPIPPGYYSVSVDRVIKDYREVPLDFPRGDGEKTLGQVEHSFVLWRKRYIIILDAAARVPAPPP
jgi:hypothetical protein